MNHEYKIEVLSNLLAGYRKNGSRINILRGVYSATLTKHYFSKYESTENALCIVGADGNDSLHIRCIEYSNEIDWHNIEKDINSFFKVER